MNTYTAAPATTLLDSLGFTSEEVLTEETIERDANKKELELPSSHYSTGVSTGVEERAIALLGAGVPSESVAAAVGVTPARISQLLSDKTFADKVAALRYENLQAHNRRDDEYDTLEDRLLAKLNKSLPLLMKPESILKAIQIVNNAKRRGQSAPDVSSNTQNVVNLILPQIIAEKFTVNLQNQVTKAGNQELLTMPSGNLLKQVEEAHTQTVLETPSEATNELQIQETSRT